MSVTQFAWAIAVQTWPILLVGIAGSTLAVHDMRRGRRKVYKVVR